MIQRKQRKVCSSPPQSEIFLLLLKNSIVQHYEKLLHYLQMKKWVSRASVQSFQSCRINTFWLKQTMIHFASTYLLSCNPLLHSLFKETEILYSPRRSVSSFLPFPTLGQFNFYLHLLWAHRLGRPKDPIYFSKLIFFSFWAKLRDSLPLYISLKALILHKQISLFAKVHISKINNLNRLWILRKRSLN